MVLSTLLCLAAGNATIASPAAVVERVAPVAVRVPQGFGSTPGKGGGALPGGGTPEPTGLLLLVGGALGLGGYRLKNARNRAPKE
jgi:hypothetical protein